MEAINGPDGAMPCTPRSPDESPKPSNMGVESRVIWPHMVIREEPDGSCTDRRDSALKWPSSAF